MLFALLALPAGGDASAQSSGALHAGPAPQGRVGKVRFTYRMASGVRRPGGNGWVSGTVENFEDREHEFEITAGARGYGRRDSGARLVGTVKAGGSVDVLLPVPCVVGGWSALTLRVGDTSDDRRLEERGNARLGLLVVAEGQRGGALGRALDQGATEFMLRVVASASEESEVVPPDWLPPRWTLLSGFDVILLDAGADGGQQRVLADAVSAGARLLVTERALGALPAGTLQERLQPLLSGSPAAWGFGSAALVPGDEPTAGTLRAALETSGLRERVGGPPGAGGAVIGVPGAAGPPAAPAPGGGPALRGMPYLSGAALRGHESAAGVPFDALLLPQALTTVLAVPTSAFALVVLAYVGLLAALLVREVRRRTQLRLLVLLPASGGALTVLVLAGGLLMEGTSVRGASRSFALLDQEAHEAAVVGGRTLYAGIGSASARPGPGTHVVPLAALGGGEGALLVHAHEGGRLDASLLPARTPVSLALTSVGPSRERLLVRAGADGALRLVSEDSFRPHAGIASVVLRLPDGRGFVADAEGRLQPASDEELADMSQRLLQPFLDAPLLTRGMLGEAWNEGLVVLPMNVGLDVDSARTVLRGRLMGELGAGPPPGAYLARIDGGALLDDLDLDIDEDGSGVHLVLGRFGPGDLP